MEMNMREAINFNTLSVDKENEETLYNDELHKYWTKDSKLNCISATTLIHKYDTFDPEFWSAYKTLESLIKEDEFKNIKPTLLDKKHFKSEYYEGFKIPKDAFENKRSEILKEWDRKRDESCVRGTAIHKQMELGHLNGKTEELKYLKLGGTFKTDISNRVKAGEQGVYPELLLSRVSEDGELRIAGQADLVIIDGYDVYILDYKSGKTMDTKSFFDRKLKRSQKMKYPLNNLDDCNFMHYSLQLSLYAWMLQKHNPLFNIKILLLIHIDHSNTVTNYECEYLKTDVERMLGHYKKQIKQDDFNRSREKVIF